jgi:hypothetical protein
MTEEALAQTAAAEPPRVSDTYALVYAATLLFLVPGSIAIGQLPFRTYTLQYVSLVTVPFVLGLVFTFLTDSTDDAKTVAKRIAILSPLIILSGVAVMFTSSLFLVPINQFLGPEYRELTTPLAALLLIALASPLVLALVRRVRTGFNWRAFIQGLVLVAALAVVGIVAYMSVFQVGALGDIARKDIVIYIIGGLVWYGPSFGISAGVWRKMELV